MILTTEPNALILPIHDRMPVIVPPADYGAWLQAEASAARLRALLGPFPHDLLVAQPVGPAVNDARQEGPVCLDPPDPAERAQGRLFSDEPDAS